LSLHQTVGEALAWLRENPPGGRIIYFYVVDHDGRLVGVVPTRRLLLSSLEMPLENIMVRRLVTLPDEATVLEACEFFIQHRLLALPVVDREHRLLGLVDVELYTDELVRLGEEEPHEPHERADELFQLIGVHLVQARMTSPLAAFRGRFPWLLCTLLGGILAALLCSRFQDVLDWNSAVLALFVPVLLGLAESVSIQSVSLTLQALQGRQPGGRTLLRRIGRELLTGLLMGGVSGLTVTIVVLLWLCEVRVGLCVLTGILGGVSCAAVLGLAIPNLLHRSRRNPHVAAGPVALVLTDLLTLLFYLTMGNWLRA
jgi:magnesium transporter